MKIVKALPPIYDEIAAAFDLKDRKVIFAWGSEIYNPHGIEISPALHAHESVHGERQGDDIEGWWRRYIAEPQFRLIEELLAHKIEYETLCQGAPRNLRRLHLRHVAEKLSSPLYGRLISFDRARTELKLRAA